MRGKRIGYVTRGILSLPQEEIVSAVEEFRKLSMEKEDWFYSLNGGEVFAQENEEGSYTLMLADEC